MSTTTTPLQEVVDGQLALIQVTDRQVSADGYEQIHRLRIAALRREAEEMPTPTDKVSLQTLQDQLTRTTRARTSIDKARKSFLEPVKAAVERWNSYLGTSKESGLQADVYAAEEILEAKKKAYLDEQAKAQREAERLLEERYQGRLKKLMDAGMSFDGTALLITEGESSLSALATQVRFATDEQMAAVLGKVEAIAERKREAEAAALQAKEAEEREQAELASRLKAKEDEQAAEAAKLKAEREALDRERAEMRKAKNDLRWNELRTLGAEAGGDGDGNGMWIGPDEPGGGKFRADTLADLSDENYAIAKQRVRDAKVKAIEEQKERERQQGLLEERELQLELTGADLYADGTWHLGVVEGDPQVTQLDLRTMTSDEWAPVLARFKEAAERTKQAESLTEVMAAPDKAANALTLERFEASADGHDPHEQADFLPVIGSQPLPEGSAVVGSQPDLMTEEDAPVLREAEKWGTGRLAYLAGYEAGYKACEAEVTEMNDGE